MFLCKYKDIFGKPKKGLHSIRMFDIAIIDMLGTLGVSYFISQYFEINFIVVFIGMLIFSVIIHKLFCVETTLTKLFK